MTLNGQNALLRKKIVLRMSIHIDAKALNGNVCHLFYFLEI